MNVRPCREENAIKMVAFVFEFNKPFSIGAIELIDSMHDGDYDELPAKRPIEDIAISIGPSGVQYSHQSHQKGISFQQIARNGEPEWAFTVNNSSVVIQCAAYTGWTNVVKRTKLISEKYLPALLDGNELHSVSLEYRDEFSILEPGSDWKSDLFNQCSNLLPRFIFETDGLWHSHLGYYSKVETAEVLTRINLDYVIQDSKKHQLVVVTQHRIDTKNIGFDLPKNELPGMHLIHLMHRLNKEIFADVLTKSMQDRIGLSI